MRPSSLKPDNRISAISVPNTSAAERGERRQHQRERHAVKEQIAQRAADNVEVEIGEHARSLTSR